LRPIISPGFTIPVLFENEDLIALDKPEALASIPERNRENRCLLTLLSGHLGQKLFVVHRLDKQASGVIVFAKHPAMHRFLNAQFAERRVHKTYLALVHGVIAEDGGLIDTPLRRYGSGRMGADRERGKPCLTEFAVEARLAGSSRVRVSPVTGRKHQIRAHFFGIGHPIVGDRLYGDKALQKTYPRLMLHSWRIGFTLPSGQALRIESEVPPAFSSAAAGPQGPVR
jgi:RluA family pseudouridine synthase